MTNKGFFHKLPIYLLAIVGCGFMYKSYVEHHISQDFDFMIKSAQAVAEKAHMSESDRRKMMDSFSNIQAIARKNNGLLTNGYK